MIWRWDFFIFKHSSADNRAGAEPRVNESASAESKTSVPLRGLLRSVDGRLAKRWFSVGNVRVERICMYSASSWARNCESLSPSLLMATR